MDARHFDALAKRLTQAGTRRSLLSLLAALPMLSGLVALLHSNTAEAKDRRRRRKQRHKRRKEPGKGKHKSACRPASIAQTCAGKCGSVQNNCKKPVDCGSCDCEAGSCASCQTCDGGECVADASQDRSCCAGPDGEQWCQAGACVPIPADTRATLEECTGRCDCVPYSTNGCFGGFPAYQEICGASRLCPLCEQCAGLVSGCVGASSGAGPAGNSYYCIFDGVAGTCNSGPCPDPQSEVCLGGRECRDICGVAVT